MDWNNLKMSLPSFLAELENIATSKECIVRPMVIVVDEANAFKEMANQAVSTVVYIRTLKHSWILQLKYQKRLLKSILS